MKLDIFSELQRALPWSEIAEPTVINDALEQGELADRYGYSCWWSVEHHGAEDFSLSSAPEMFHVALAMRTKRIHIGHAGVLAPFRCNHPTRVAERGAWLDILSNGRLEMGLARSSASEWDNFEVDKETTQQQFDELATMLPKMWANETFSWESDLIRIPEINVVPKPLQKFPPLWACGMSKNAANSAGRLGIGYIGTTVMEPVSKTVQLRQAYLEGVSQRPAGVVESNNQFALFTFVHCAPTREEAIANRAAEAAMWYVNRAPEFFKLPRAGLINNIRGTTPAEAESWRHRKDLVDPGCDPDDPHPAIRLLNRQKLGMKIDPEEAYEVMTSVDSVIIGDPEECFNKMQAFKTAGIDRLLCLQQFGTLSHAQACGSIRTLGEQVLPYIAGPANGAFKARAAAEPALQAAVNG